MRSWELFLALLITAPLGYSCAQKANEQRMTPAVPSEALKQAREAWKAKQDTANTGQEQKEK